MSRQGGEGARPLYEVEFWVDDALVSSVRLHAWSPHEAFVTSWATPEYRSICPPEGERAVRYAAFRVEDEA